MTTVGDVLEDLDAWAPFSNAAAWDPVGLQLGDPAAPVTTAAVCHEVTAEVVDAVLAGGVEALVTYHPLLFRPVSRVVPGPGPAGMAFDLMSRGVAVIAAHTNIDAAPGGTADALADALGLTSVQAFGSVDGADHVKVVVFVPDGAVEAVRAAMAAAGAGSIGLYRACSFEAAGTGRFVATDGTNPAVGAAGGDNRVDELRLEMKAPAAALETVVAAARGAHPYEEPAIDIYGLITRGPAIGRIGTLSVPHGLRDFAAAVRTSLGEPPIRYSGHGSTSIQTVAVVPGAGADFAGEAQALGADVLVTGDARHHAAVAAFRKGLAIVDATHEGTERPGMQALYRFVADMVTTLDLTSINTNPWSSP